MLRLHDYLSSGNGYKVRLLLSQLGIPFERIEYDIVEGVTHSEAFLAMNANGKIPVLELEDGTFLAESNAVLVYLAEDTPYLPQDRLERAQALQWMFFEQYSHEPNIATVRFWTVHLEMNDLQRAMLPQKREQGHAALRVMERHLDDREYFAGSRYSIADICLYAYTHVAPEGGFELEGYPAVRAWLARVSSQPGHIPITQG